MFSAADTLAARLGLPRVLVLDTVGSTLDVAHQLGAEGTPAGTLIVAREQTAGRGRQGRVWRSKPGAGLWMTIVERPTDAAALEVMSLRIGIALAAALDAYAATAMRLKWPNDLYDDRGKIGGILVEARWRDGRPDWVAIGVGINLEIPAEEPRASALMAGAGSENVLMAIVPAIRSAAARGGALDEQELRDYRTRDLAAGQPCREPMVGIVRGIDASGALLIDVASETRSIRAGSLILNEREAGGNAP